MMFININVQNLCIMYKKKNSTYPIKEFFDDVKNDLNLNTSLEHRKIKIPSF